MGHNQFIGVSHLSQDVARSKLESLSNFQKIIEIIKYSLDMNVTGMMLSTHPLAKEILRHVKMRGLHKDLNLYPLIPYAHGYVRKVNETGILGLLSNVLGPASTLTKFKILFKGSSGLLKKDLYSLLGALIDVELLPFRGFHTKAIFLHNVLTDLSLALGVKEIFQFFVEYIRKNYGASAGFGTYNFARLVKKFDEWGICKPLVMASFNKIGFQMNPSRQECEQCLREYEVDVLAMSTLAAGHLKPREAYQYLFSLPKIKSIVVGVSTKEHAEETFTIIQGRLDSVDVREMDM